MRCCRNLPSYGVQPNWSDYPPEVREAISAAREIFYPSPLFADLFQSLGKAVYPRNYYAFLGNKIRQTNLFQLLEIPHPRTRLYYGRRPQDRILRDFRYPFVAKNPVGSSMGKGVFLIRNPSDLADYVDGFRPAYIQEYLPIDRDLRVVLIRGEVVHAYWRIARPGEFRNNVSQGAEISFENISEEALAFALQVSVRCGFDEVGLDICQVHDRHYVLEANMVFGLEGFKKMDLDLQEIFRNLEKRDGL